MKTFTELYNLAESLKNSYDGGTITDTVVANTLYLCAETKFTCESNDGLIYEGMNVRLLRDVCVASLNYAGNTKLLKARFYSVYSQLKAIVQD